ncbi:IclR family transcriptional regulator [Haladaptatus pallidirubidus]|uniref:IclR family transcriptional regulator n=1 Tax=Haladaptatus pallidirubidus TaxID=1008152 RepID=A0AAV3UJ68_9EURY|nr:IclR family transcriptional regulator [Haladaptatus pallidirubidus]
MDAEEEYPIRTTAKAFQVIEGLMELRVAGVTELAAHLHLSKSSVYKHLDTLRRLGYVVKKDDVYQLGFRFFELGNGLRERNELYRTAKSYMNNLAMTTGETVSLAVEESDEVVYIYSIRSGTTDDGKQGTRAPLAADVAGKAILAYKPTAERETLVSSADWMDESLLAELRTIRDHRLAIERGTTEDGQNCVAVPIRDTHDYPLGALTVCGSTASLSGKRLEEDITGLVVSAAKSIEVALAS